MKEEITEILTALLIAIAFWLMALIIITYPTPPTDFFDVPFIDSTTPVERTEQLRI